MTIKTGFAIACSIFKYLTDSLALRVTEESGFEMAFRIAGQGEI
jgi:hypothetical protein